MADPGEARRVSGDIDNFCDVPDEDESQYSYQPEEIQSDEDNDAIADESHGGGDHPS